MEVNRAREAGLTGWPLPSAVQATDMSVKMAMTTDMSGSTDDGCPGCPNGGGDNAKATHSEAVSRYKSSQACAEAL